jgi:hypothetical protein
MGKRKKMKNRRITNLAVIICLSLSKTTQLTERIGLELRWDVFNAFNFANFANPNADLSDETDFGQITRSVGGPRTMQFGVKLKF